MDNFIFNTFGPKPINILVLGCGNEKVCDEVFFHHIHHGGGLTLVDNDEILDKVKEKFLKTLNQDDGGFQDLSYFEELEFTDNFCLEVLRVSTFFPDRDDLIILDIKDEEIKQECLKLIDQEKSKVFIL